MAEKLASLWDMALGHEVEFHRACAWLMIATGVCVVFLELGGGVQAAYGRYSSSPSAGWYGPKIPATLAWVFQESWAVLVAIALLPYADPACRASPANRALCAMFLTHYTYRSFVFPLRMRGGKPMPIVICLLAAAFCLFNGYLQARLWTSLHVFTLESPTDVACLVGGGAMWLAGFYSNLDSDAILRNLRKPGETGYKIPCGGMFEYVSGANYFGELRVCCLAPKRLAASASPPCHASREPRARPPHVTSVLSRRRESSSLALLSGEFFEWCGYALASRCHIGCVAFAIFTFCNTGPRAYHHHQWYLSKFADYPRDRRVFFPYLW